eukprot:3788281-Pleurochrysis_carterae.AAC.1
MIRELERVERELRERDRAEITSLRAQVAALAASQAQASPSVQPPHRLPSDESSTPSNRVQGRATLSILLNVADLCAAIAIGAMQLLDN